MDKQSVGNFIAEQRKEKHMTQKQLAEKLNVTDKAVSKWETGKCYPDVETLERLSELFDITVNDVLSGKVLDENNKADEADKNVIQLMKDAKKEKIQTAIKAIIASSILLFFLFNLLRLTSVMFQLVSESTNLNGLEITYYNAFDFACADCYIADEETKVLEITIPDECNGIPIKKIGRKNLSPFFIDIADLYMNAPENSDYSSTVYTIDALTSNAIEESFTIQNVVFKLNIGKNINQIRNVDMDTYYPHINEDGSLTFYHPVVDIYCSKDNEYFYSKDGKLFNKKTNELITDFAYNYINN
ncbi:MAG: helix-turn-helix transcriptional regulator [Clostridia bacterium]|nr:helix-turn-helix transcriptional regulator [Clostridia bacterium]